MYLFEKDNSGQQFSNVRDVSYSEDGVWVDDLYEDFIETGPLAGKLHSEDDHFHEHWIGVDGDWYLAITVNDMALYWVYTDPNHCPTCGGYYLDGCDPHCEDPSFEMRVDGHTA